jgi:hypothetical protein
MRGSTYVGNYRYLKCQVEGELNNSERLVQISSKGKSYSLLVETEDLARKPDGSIYLRVLVVQNYLETAFLPAPTRESGDRIIDIVPHELACLCTTCCSCASTA